MRQDEPYRAKHLHYEGFGFCTTRSCKFFSRQVPIRKWVQGAIAWTCPLCRCKLAPLTRREQLASHASNNDKDANANRT
jgi:hypothetical protein